MEEYEARIPTSLLTTWIVILAYYCDSMLKTPAAPSTSKWVPLGPKGVHCDAVIWGCGNSLSPLYS